MMKLTATFSVLAALLPYALGQAAEWGQCGGIGWTGPTVWYARFPWSVDARSYVIPQRFSVHLHVAQLLLLAMPVKVTFLVESF